jgi:hypothetical protein
MTAQNITIKQGDSTTLTETVTGLSSLSGFTAKMYIYDPDGTETDIITGTINNFDITYAIVNEDSKLYSIKNHFFETKIFDTNDLVYTLSEGIFTVEKALESDPT